MTSQPLRKWIIVAALLALLASSSSSPVTAASSNTAMASSAPAAPADWLLFQNNVWKYSINYPPNWTAATVLTNSSASAMNVIRQRDELTGLSNAFVSIDVWQKSPATNLINWVNANQGQMLAFAEVTIPAATNAVIGGQPALIIAQPESGMSPGLMMAYIDAADRVLVGAIHRWRSWNRSGSIRDHAGHRHHLAPLSHPAKPAKIHPPAGHANI